MHVKGVEWNSKFLQYVFAHNFLNIQWIFNMEKVLESGDNKECIYFLKSMSKMLKTSKTTYNTWKDMNMASFFNLK